MTEVAKGLDQEDYVSDDVQAVAEYRSVSGLAVAGAVLGVLSLLTLLHLGFVLLALAAVVVSLVALNRIAKSEGRLIGRTAALLGLALSTTLGVAGIVHTRTVATALSKEASQWGVEWCQLVMDGEVTTAVELQNPPTMRRPFDESLAEYYETNKSAIEKLDAFKANPVVQLLSSAPNGAKVKPQQLVSTASERGGRFVVTHDFSLEAPGQSPVSFRLLLRREKMQTIGGGAWYISDQAFPEEF